MTLLHPLEHVETVEASLAGEEDGGMKVEHMGVQADVRFLKAILVGLAFLTCMLGAAAVMAMP